MRSPAGLASICCRRAFRSIRRTKRLFRRPQRHPRPAPVRHLEVRVALCRECFAAAIGLRASHLATTWAGRASAQSVAQLACRFPASVDGNRPSIRPAARRRSSPRRVHHRGERVPTGRMLRESGSQGDPVAAEAARTVHCEAGSAMRPERRSRSCSASAQIRISMMRASSARVRMSSFS
jgi:hypothetical protein